MQDSLAASPPTSPTDINAEVSNAWRTVDNMVDGFFALLPKLFLAVVVFLAFWLIAKGVRKAVRTATEGRKSSNVGQVLGRLAYFGLLVLGVLVSITVVAPGMGIGELVGLLGIGGVAIGFAFQDIFQNLLAGVLILLREPFREGDEITSGDYTGTVEKIETRATFIRTYDGKRAIIPNSQIYTDPVTVITAYEMVRSHYDIGIGYGDDIAEAKRIALETVRGIEGVLQTPAPDVLTWELAGSSVNIRVRWWTDPTRSNVVTLWDRVLQQTAGALAGAGIDLPFPTQQILFHDQTEATDGDRRRQREGWPAGPNPPEPGNIPRALAQSNGQQGSRSSDELPRA